MKASDGYRFDAGAAKAEILARRVGRNELNAIVALRDFVAAELEYAYTDSNNNGIHDYAQQILSDPGQRNGLYWDVKDEKPVRWARSFGRVTAEGYELAKPGEPVMYHGYAFRVLKAQGRHVTGGARGSVVRGLMIGGFAEYRMSVKYGVSGVKTFVVNHEGVVWEKDLGPRTGRPSPRQSAGTIPTRRGSCRRRKLRRRFEFPRRDRRATGWLLAPRGGTPSAKSWEAAVEAAKLDDFHFQNLTPCHRLLGRPGSESGCLRHGDGAQGRLMPPSAAGPDGGR